MRNTAYHQQANAITGRVLQEIRLENVQLLDEVKAIEENILRIMHTSSHNQENIDPNHQSANATTGINVQNKMTKNLQLMQREIQDLKAEIANNNNNVNNRKTKRDKEKKRPRTIVSKYCWTHGAWHHISKNCKFKADDEYCQPVNE